MKNILTLILIASLSKVSLAHFGSKGPYGGSVSCAIAYDSTVYLGTFTGGVYESTNSKIVGWRARPVGLKSGRITALTHSGKYLFAGTADSGMYIFNGSVGSDRYWMKINNGLTNLQITSLVALDSVSVMAGTNGGGIFKTTNKGNSWTSVNNAILHHLDIKGLVKAGNRIIHIAESGGVYASDDQGTSWIDFNDSHTDDINGTVAISYNAVTDELLVLNQDGLYKASSVSTTLSPTYNLVETGLASPTNIRSISNNGTNWYLATDHGVYSASGSGSISWTLINNGLTTDVTAVVPFQNKIVAGTHNEGIFKASIPFSSWTSMNAGFNNLRTYAMALSGATVVVAATEKGVFVSKDLATSYNSANKGLNDSLNVNDLTFANSNLFAATKNGGVYMSSDTGSNWTAINTGLLNMNIKKIFASNTSLYILCSSGNIYSSSLSNITWNLVQDGLPANVNPSSITFAGSKIILGTYDDGVFVKKENETSWTQANTDLSNLVVTSVTALGNKIFAGTRGSGVFVSDTSTIKWTKATIPSITHTELIGLKGENVQALAVNDNFVFASYRGGLLASSDNGVTWVAAGNQFNLPSYADVNKISFTSTRVFVTTPDNCLYSNALSELPTGVNSVAENISSKTFDLYPNPNNGSFNIGIKETEEVTEIRIFNMAGMQFKNILMEGNSVKVDLPKGMYLVKVRLKDTELTRKIVIQ